MEWIFYVVAIVFSLLGLGCVFLVVMGLPGNWLMLGMSLFVEFADRFYLPVDQQQTFSWKILILCFVLAVIAEILEFAIGALGAKKAGSSKSGMLGAVVGGFIGAIFGTGIPIPILGTLIGAIIGTFIGSLVGEIKSKEVRTANELLKPALGATIGRLLGTLTKIPIALTIWITLSIAVFWE